jgi:hypothetical protein
MHSIPLNTSDDEEEDDWGWDESDGGAGGGDVEMAMAQPKQAEIPAGKLTRELSAESRGSTARRRMSPPSSFDASPPSPPPLPMKITSLGTSNNTSRTPSANSGGPSKPKPPVKKQQPKSNDDDIFASIGLSAKPQFQHPVVPKRPPATAPAVLQSKENNSWRKDLAADDTEGADGAADWDDSDLDDLLND